MITLRELVAAARVPVEIVGEEKFEIRTVNSLYNAAKGDLTFCGKRGDEALAALRATAASAVFCRSDLPRTDLPAAATLLLVDDPRLAFLRVVQQFFAPPRPTGIHPHAVVEGTVAEDVYVGPFAFVAKGASVGPCSVIHGNVHLYPGTVIGRNVVVHAGTVIGADGYGYQRNETGEMEKFPHLGGVIIEDHVEIGSNTSIDRGTLGDTRILTGARIDNQVHIAHNVVVGRHAAVIAQAMIGGSTIIGDHAWIAPSACVRDRISIGAHATVGLGAVVVKDVPDGVTVMGAPARLLAEQKRVLAHLARVATEGDQ